MNRQEKTDADVLIVGAGASGLAAACAAASAGASVIAVDGNDRAGRKLSATGNGRCNLTNTNCGSEKYNENAMAFVERVFRRFHYSDTVRLFQESGLLIREEQEGRCYPYSGQASAVTELLTEKAGSLGARFELGDTVSDCFKEDSRFHAVFTSGKRLTARSLILASGGRAGLQFGSTGDGYGFAKRFGHTLRAPAPALVACESDDPRLSGLKGRARALVTLFEDGKEKYSEYGEVQFTGSGLSGICVMNLTRFMEAARPVPAKKKRPRPGRSDNTASPERIIHEYEIGVDFIPEYSEQEILEILRSGLSIVPLPEALAWLVNDRIARAVAEMAGNSADRAVTLLKHFQVRINHTKGWNDAQVTRGGVRLEEIDPDTMGSRLMPGLFFCGEVMDVDGPCGGYNLQWAWSSGSLSGVSAAEYAKC